MKCGITLVVLFTWLPICLSTSSANLTRTWEAKVTLDSIFTTLIGLTKPHKDRFLTKKIKSNAHMLSFTILLQSTLPESKVSFFHASPWTLKFEELDMIGFVHLAPCKVHSCSCDKIARIFGLNTNSNLFLATPHNREGQNQQHGTFFLSQICYKLFIIAELPRVSLNKTFYDHVLFNDNFYSYPMTLIEVVKYGLAHYPRSLRIPCMISALMLTDTLLVIYTYLQTKSQLLEYIISQDTKHEEENEKSDDRQQQKQLYYPSYRSRKKKSTINWGKLRRKLESKFLLPNGANYTWLATPNNPMPISLFSMASNTLFSQPEFFRESKACKRVIRNNGFNGDKGNESIKKVYGVMLSGDSAGSNRTMRNEQFYSSKFILLYNGASQTDDMIQAYQRLQRVFNTTGNVNGDVAANIHKDDDDDEMETTHYSDVASYFALRCLDICLKSSQK